jgi:response regulator RpfG family c-di-GMP phosphodiesterase
MSDEALLPSFAVVIVDDDPLGLGLLQHLVDELPATRTVCFGDAAAALEWCRGNDPDLVITDQQMPGMQGTELVRRLRAESRLREVPIMMITTVEDREVRYEALEAGANDFLTKPIDATEVKARTRNMLAIRRGQRVLLRRAQSLAEEVQLATAVIAAREHEVILRLSRAAEYRDWETGAHIVRVAGYARVIARQLNLSEAERETIFRAAPMHDIGKIGVPDYILLKPGALDDSEFAIIKQHTVIGYQILAGSESELLRTAADIALTHHERYAGSGYPDGRRGADIPLAGRIVAVADVFDALTSERPYKKEWPVQLAWSYLGQHAGSQFDPDCVQAFKQGEAEVNEVRESFPDSRDLADHRRYPIAATEAAS